MRWDVKNWIKQKYAVHLAKLNNAELAIIRFLVWIVDFIVVSIFFGIIFALISFSFWFNYNNDVEKAYRNIQL